MYRFEMRTEELPFIPVNNNYGPRLKVLADKRRWRGHVLSAGEPPPEPLKKAHCVFERCSSMKPETNHLIWSFKLIKEALVETKILEGLSAIHEPIHLWTPGRPGSGYTRVIVSEVLS